MRESTVEGFLLKECAKRGLKTRKIKWLGHDGAPDRVLYVDGGVYIELKAPGKKLRRIQEKEIQDMREAGMKVLVIDSIEGVERFFNEL